MPHKKPKKRPYCKKCGLFLVGGISGYCPSAHMDYANIPKLINKCEKLLLDYPNVCTERTKVEIHIKEMRKKL